MSYSFSFRAASRQDAITKVSEELAKVVSAQPFHQADQSQAQQAADAFIGLLPDDPGRDVAVSVNGSGYTVGDELRQVSMSVNAQLIDRETPAA